jgi:hypothetical protein
MDMDLHSAGGATEHLSTGGTEQFSPMAHWWWFANKEVFEHETLPDDMPSAMTPNMPPVRFLRGERSVSRSHFVSWIGR